MRMLTNHSLCVLLFMLLAVVACAHAQPLHQATAPPAVGGHTQMVFRVASAQSDQMLVGVRVTMIGDAGAELELGQTDMFGSLSVPKAVLREHQARVVLFMRERFFTGAIRVDDPRADFYAFDEQYIELAVFAVI